MRILFVASEAHPFVKTGGLADVAGSLPKVLHELGHDVRLVLPRYGDIDSSRFRLLPMMPEMKVAYGTETIYGSIMRCSFPNTDLPVYFVDEPSFSQRKGIYGNGKVDFPDNDRRFAFFNQATLWLIKGLDWQPDVIHLNDWQTGLIPALLKHHPAVAHDPFFMPIRTLFAIHNMAYQGNFEKFVVPSVALPWDVFTQDGMEFYGRASFLKSGIMFSDELVTVSPTYAKEIQTDEFGAGMTGALQQRSTDLHGIINGIDMNEWNPETDPHIPNTFSASDISGKAACKRDLQKLGHLKQDKDIPLIGMASRMVAAKGFRLIAQALEELLEMDAQFFLLGSGDDDFERLFLQISERHPERFRTHIGYDVPLSHRIMAGSDFFLMPSLFEPCGLTQLYAMRYGTIPIVRRTGGLADTVREATVQSLEEGIGTGFSFKEATSDGLVSAVKQAVNFYHKKHPLWQKLVGNAMAQDFSWHASAAEYVKLYQRLTWERDTQPGVQTK